VIEKPDIVTQYNQVFVQNETLKRELELANQEIAELRETLRIAVEALDEIAPDSIVGYCVRLKLEGKVDFVIKVPDEKRDSRGTQ
jgi:hypothetical protein